MYSKIVNRLRIKLYKFLNIPINYQFKNISIKLPAEHLLPDYQKAHPRYDRFLPHLASYISHIDTIVDIGANVGDTVAGMVENNPNARYLCIEPDESFFKHLEKNVEIIKRTIPNADIQTIQALVGRNVSNVSLDGKGGTKHAVINSEGNINSASLDNIIAKTTSRIRLLKSDVDGFDYDVLDSSMEIIVQHAPIIFFECYYDFIYQKNGYTNTLKTLYEIGYKDFTVFDNFGEVILRTGDLNILTQLINYLWQQNIGLATRTIYYFDILAVQKNDVELIDTVLEEY